MTLIKIQTIRNPELWNWKIIKNEFPSYINPEFIIDITPPDFWNFEATEIKWYYINLSNNMSFSILEDEYIRILKILKDKVI